MQNLSHFRTNAFLPCNQGHNKSYSNDIRTVNDLLVCVVIDRFLADKMSVHRLICNSAEVKFCLRLLELQQRDAKSHTPLESIH